MARTSLSRAFAAAIDAGISATAILDARGTILYTNATWDKFSADQGGVPEKTGVGVNYLNACEPGSDASRKVALVLSGDSKVETLEYPCHSPTEKRWFRMRCVRIDEPPVAAIVTHDDLTDHYLANEARQTAAAVAQRFAELKTAHEHAISSLNTIGHALRTPLTPVKMQLAILDRQIGRPLEARHVQRMSRNIDRLIGAVETAMAAIKMEQAPLRDVRMAGADLVAKLESRLHAAGVKDATFAIHGHGHCDADINIIAPAVIELTKMLRARSGASATVIEVNLGQDTTVLFRDNSPTPGATSTKPFSASKEDGTLGLALYMCETAAVLHGGTFKIDNSKDVVEYHLSIPASHELTVS